MGSWTLDADYDYPDTTPAQRAAVRRLIRRRLRGDDADTILAILGLS